MGFSGSAGGNEDDNGDENDDSYNGDEPDNDYTGKTDKHADDNNDAAPPSTPTDRRRRAPSGPTAGPGKRPRQRADTVDFVFPSFPAFPIVTPSLLDPWSVAPTLAAPLFDLLATKLERLEHTCRKLESGLLAARCDQATSMDGTYHYSECPLHTGGLQRSVSITCDCYARFRKEFLESDG